MVFFPLGVIFEVLVFKKKNTTFVHDVTWITVCNVFHVLFGNTSPVNPIRNLRGRFQHLEVKIMMVAVLERV